MTSGLSAVGRTVRALFTTVGIVVGVAGIAHDASGQRVPARSGAPLSDRLDAMTRTTITRLADSLDLEELPGYALRDKAAEGVLKGATDARVLAAVVSLAERLRESRALLGRDALDDEHVAVASALYAGVPRAAIARLVVWKRERVAVMARRGATSRSPSLSMPLAILADLTTQHVPGELAIGSLEQLLDRGAGDADLVALRERVGRDIRRGERPQDAFNANVQLTHAALERRRPQ